MTRVFFTRTGTHFARKRYGKIGLAAIKGAMRNILLAIVAVTLSVSFAAAEQPGQQKLNLTPSQEKVLPLKRDAGRGNSCAAYGPGFVKVEGSGTCVKVGGSVQVGAGTSR